MSVMGAESSKIVLESLPAELRSSILGFLPHADLGRALCACKAMSSVSDHAWRAACERRWPRWAEIAAEPGAQWRQVYELLALREGEASTVVDVQAIARVQTVIMERHRAILTGWMCEVSSAWQLESTVVFKAVECLDNYLAQNPVEKLGRFQLVGMACLRATMRDAACRTAAGCQTDKMLDTQRFAYISDNINTPEEIEEMTQVVSAGVPDWLRASPTSKMFLRSFWHRAAERGVVGADEIHVYTMSSFLLQLALLDLPCAASPPSQLAAAALSLALFAFAKPAWPAALQRCGSYLPEDLEPARQRLARAQANASLEAAQLRRLWCAQVDAHGYLEFSAEWAQLREIIDNPDALLGPGPEPATPDSREAAAAPGALDTTFIAGAAAGISAYPSPAR